MIMGKSEFVENECSSNARAGHFGTLAWFWLRDVETEYEKGKEIEVSAQYEDNPDD